MDEQAWLGLWLNKRTGKKVWVTAVCAAPEGSDRQFPRLKVRQKRGSFGNGSMAEHWRSSERFLSEYTRGA